MHYIHGRIQGAVQGAREKPSFLVDEWGGGVQTIPGSLLSMAYTEIRRKVFFGSPLCTKNKKIRHIFLNFSFYFLLFSLLVPIFHLFSNSVRQGGGGILRHTCIIYPQKHLYMYVQIIWTIGGGGNLSSINSCKSQPQIPQPPSTTQGEPKTILQKQTNHPDVWLPKGTVVTDFTCGAPRNPLKQHRKTITLSVLYFFDP